MSARQIFVISSIIITGVIVGLSYFVSRHFLYLFIFFGPFIILGIYHMIQRKHAILRNYPVIGKLRHLLEDIRPEIQQYFIEDDLSGRPISREFRSIVYERAKQTIDTLPFGTRLDVNAEGYEWANHSLQPKEVNLDDLKIMVGGRDCTQPHLCSRLNISAMSFGALSQNAVLALNAGAKKGGFYHNTGEGGLSPYHLKPGGDIVWQIGTGYFGCRTKSGNFDEGLFKEKAAHPHVKMIEIKLSQGAKPSHGGILPAPKVNQEIADIRHVEIGKDVISPPIHSAFYGPQGLVKFVQKLRELSGGKPVGFKLCIGNKNEFTDICKAMVEADLLPDFITVDGAEGGTGAAPLEFSNHLGVPLKEGLSFVENELVKYELRDKIKIISAGKVLTAFNMIQIMSLGADILNCARAMMLAVGCIQALKCNTNRCPTGVTTNNPSLTVGLDPKTKSERVYSFHKETLKDFAQMLGAMGLKNPSELTRSHVYRRITRHGVKTYAEIYPSNS